MRSPTHLAEATLTIALDIRHPFSFLALGPAIDFGREMGLRPNWLPLRGAALRAPTRPEPDEDRSLRHRRSRARMIAREIRVYARAQGLHLEEPYREGPTTATTLAWLWVREHRPDLLEDFLIDLFERYWSLSLDPEDLDQVSDRVAAMRLDVVDFHRFARGEGPAIADRVAGELREAGFVQSPAYCVAGDLFFGRQHLSMLRWILRHRSGPRPI